MLKEIISQLEHCFDIDMKVYYLDQDNLDYIQSRGCEINKFLVHDHLSIFAAYVTCGQHGKRTANVKLLNVLVGHVSENEPHLHVYEITRIENFVNQYRCGFCLMSFKGQSRLKRHMMSKRCLSVYCQEAAGGYVIAGGFMVLGSHCPNCQCTRKRKRKKAKLLEIGVDEKCTTPRAK